MSRLGTVDEKQPHDSSRVEDSVEDIILENPGASDASQSWHGSNEGVNSANGGLSR